MPTSQVFVVNSTFLWSHLSSYLDLSARIQVQHRYLHSLGQPHFHFLRNHYALSPKMFLRIPTLTKVNHMINVIS